MAKHYPFKKIKESKKKKEARQKKKLNKLESIIFLTAMGNIYIIWNKLKG